MTEDWLAVWLGAGLFALSLAGLFGADLLGWAVTTSVWTDAARALGPASKAYASLPGSASLLATYVFLLALLTVGAKTLGWNIAKFAAGFTAVFFASYLSWIAGSWAYIAATPDRRAALKISWSMNLTNEAGFIVALLAGLVIGNLIPNAATRIREAIRPELYIKTAIVILGGVLGVTAVEQRALAASVMFDGLCAIVAAYLIYWAVVYYIARRYFGFSREWAAPLASGISICGVSAAIATGSAIKARPVVPIMVSSLVVIFAVVELVLLP
ncbi:MAG: putative sulfate exporter family transporter, partial [Acidobacteria bacterium]|nr:putative sulfate exporter family transporter [Acidobacteriota bacterium]